MFTLLSRLFIKDCKNYTDPAVRTKYGILTGIVGIALNFLLFAAKLAAGIITSSVSVIADAVNNLSDAGSSTITLVGYKIAGRPADKEHPFGHGRVEYVAGLLVSAVIVFMGFELGKSAIGKILSPEDITFDALSLAILIAAIFVKLYIFLYNNSTGKKISSAPMRAVAMDSLSDCISTLSVIIGLVVYLVFGVNIDGYVGVLVALFVLKTGIDAAKESLAPLVGEKADAEFVQGIKEYVLSRDGIIGVHDLMVHNYGVGENIISMHAEVPAEMGFMEAHELIDETENELRKKYSSIVTIHMDPVEADTEVSLRCKSIVSGILKDISSEISMHDFRITNGQNNKNLIFDIEVPFGMKMTDTEIKETIIRKVKEADNTLNPVICVDKKVY